MQKAGLEVVSRMSELITKHDEFSDMIEFVFNLADILNTRDMRIFSSSSVRLVGPGGVL